MKYLNRTKKSGIVLLFALMAGGGAYAQRGAIEITGAGGVSINSAPSGNMPYKGNKIALNYSALLNGTFNIHRSMSAGIEVRSLELSNKSSVVYLIPSTNIYAPVTVGGENKRFVFAKNVMSVCGVFNGKLNTYKGYYYGGIAAGYGFAMQNASNWKSEKEAFRTPDKANGFVWGIQAGYTQGITSALGINIEGALRNYSLNYKNATGFFTGGYFPGNMHCNITAYTITVGLKVRIMPKYRPQNAIPAMRGKGRSIKP